MSIKTVRVYFPYFPFPPNDGAAHVVYDQIVALSKLGFEVEFVCWMDNWETIAKKRRQTFPGPFQDSFPESVRIQVLSRETFSGVKLPAFAQKFLVRMSKLFGGGLERWIRVGMSLASQYSSPELYYYPPGKKPKDLKTVDLGIYNYSFSYPWLKHPGLKPGGLKDEGLKKAESANSESAESRHSELKQAINESEVTERHRVVVFHNLESELFEERAEKATSRLIRWIHHRNAEKLKSHEVELTGLTDEVWFISPEDQEELKGRVETDHTRFIGPGFSKELRQKRVARFLARAASGDASPGPVLGFVGALDFAPNFEGALWIVEQLVPRLAANGFKGKILMAGRGAPPELKRKAFPYPFIHILGFVPDLEDFWAQLDWSLVPHVSGSGVRIKFLESLASGVPILATQGAVERVHPNLIKNQLVFVSNNPQFWCDTILSHDQDGLRKKCAREAFPPELDSLQGLAFLREERFFS